MRESVLISRTLPFGPPEILRRGDDLELIHPTTKIVYRLNSTAQAIWDSVEQPTSILAVNERLARTFEISSEESEPAVLSFLDHLEELGLIEIRDLEDPAAAMRSRYLRLLQRALVNLIYPEHELRIDRADRQPVWGMPAHDLESALAKRVAHDRLQRDVRVDLSENFEALVRAKLDGRIIDGRPSRYSHTMVGLRRLEHLQWCAEHVFRDGVAGDFLEAGVCQGGATIFMRALQVAFKEGHRLTWAADSFQGLPVPSDPRDDGYDLSEGIQPWLAATLDSVRENFRTYDLLSDEVRFLEGWFSETLPGAPVGQLAILRLDADIYASTMDALVALYEKVSPGGFVIIDDYYAFAPCRKAVEEFRGANGVTEPVRRIDWSAVYWRKRFS